MLVRIYNTAVETSNALNAAVDPEVTSNDMATFYSDCLRADRPGRKCDYEAINAAILKRWPKGLLRIKTLAWRLAGGKHW